MIEIQLMRVATQDGTTVHWQNALMGHLGQSGTYEFETEQQAAKFAAYARQDGAPSLANDVLEPLGLVPKKRAEVST